jgi:hypothetical protein
MNIKTLKTKLEEAGCSESHYSINTRENDTFCLEKFGDEWWVFSTEHGIVDDPEFRSVSEADACAYLWEKMQGMRHDHLDHIPSPVVHPTLYRAFVHGAAIFTVRQHFPDLPLNRY